MANNNDDDDDGDDNNTVRSIAMSVSVCLSARVLRVQTSRNFQHMLPVAVAGSFSDDNAICYALPVS